jgi:hypothetical protein
MQPGIRHRKRRLFQKEAVCATAIACDDESAIAGPLRRLPILFTRDSSNAPEMAIQFAVPRSFEPRCEQVGAAKLCRLS